MVTVPCRRCPGPTGGRQVQTDQKAKYVNVSVENLGPCKWLARVEVPQADVGVVFDQVTLGFQKQAKFPGFRPGKAPKHLVMRAHEGGIRKEVSDRLVRSAIQNLENEHKIRVLDLVNVEMESPKRGESASITLTVESFPDFELPNYKGLKLRRLVAEVTAEDEQKALYTLRDRMAKYNDLDRPLQKGDYALINYSGTTEGKPVSEIMPTAVRLGKGSNILLLIQEDVFLPGFTDALIGASKGDKRKVEVTLPETMEPELRGKQIVYEVEVVGVNEKVLPEENDEFAQRLDAPSLQELREAIRVDLVQDLNRRRRELMSEQIYQALLNQTGMELPEGVLARQTQSEVLSIVRENRERGVSNEAVEAQKDAIYKAASERAQNVIKLDFIIGEIAKKESITVKEEDMIPVIGQLAQQQGMSFEAMVRKLRNDNQFGTIQGRIRHHKVLEFLELNAEIEDSFVAPNPGA